MLASAKRTISPPGRKFQFDESHARLIARLARRLFEQTKPLHNLDEDNLLLLEVAALLHDIGHFINSRDHEKQGYYLLNTNRLIGLTACEQKLVASLVLNHRPKKTLIDDTVRCISQNDRIILNKLTVLLRLADAMDISHAGSVSDVSLTELDSGWSIQLFGKNDMMLAKWAVAKHKSLFEGVFGVTLQIELSEQYEYTGKLRIKFGHIFASPCWA